MTTDLSLGEIEKIIASNINLPSPPSIAVQILNTIQNADSSTEDLERIISADPALASKLLRIANSAFYSLPNAVTTIGRAISILGTNVIKNIALSFVIAKNLQGENTSHFNFDYFWRRSVTAAVAAELVAATLQIKSEEIFVTALLQDIGVLMMFLIKGKEYESLLQRVSVDENISLLELERETFHFDHQLLSHVFLDKWRIPDCITNPIRYHHEPEHAPAGLKTQVTILNTANLLSAIYAGHQATQKLSVLEEKMSTQFSIAPEVTRTLADDVARKAIDVLNIFEIDLGKIKPYSQMLQEANDELGKLNLTYEQLVLELKQSKERAEQFAAELRSVNSQLEQLAFRDGLTNLYNHRYFQEILSTEMARAKRYGRSLSLLIFDIDHFKVVNDSHGHTIGDQVLVNLADNIVKAVRPSDIVARYGGEEFAVILPETSTSGMRVFAERLRRCVQAISTPISKTQAVTVTISIGGTEFIPGQDIPKRRLVETADRALYQSKANGRNCVTLLPCV
jgi:diguanylate cyclase (GGDEF)-like protein